MWQFGYVQTIPPHSLAPRLCLEDIDGRWIHFSEYFAPVDQICVVPGQCAANYIDWFYMISHPFMRPAHPKDSARHPRIVHDDTYVESDIPQYLVAATAMEEAPIVVTYIFSLL